MKINGWVIITDNRKLAFARLKTERSPRPAKISSMGIRGLTHFVHSTKNLWTTIDLQDTKLVIRWTGSKFAVSSRTVASIIDAEVNTMNFYQVVVEFFVALKSSHVHCFVVFDGAIDPSGKKLETIKKRAEEGPWKLSTNCLHLVISIVLYHFHFCLLMCFKQALRDNGIPFAICDRWELAIFIWVRSIGKISQ